jgi:hypothetical protein
MMKLIAKFRLQRSNRRNQLIVHDMKLPHGTFSSILVIGFIVCYCLTFSLFAAVELPKKVAILFLTTGDLNHSEFWKEYLSPHLDKFNIYIHSKTRMQDPFFAQYMIAEHVHTTWDNTLKAERALLTEAYANKENYKFILLSNSCMPLVDADILYQTLVRDNLSYFYWTHGGWWEPTDPREVTALPKRHRKGNHQWFTLNRKHARLCVRDRAISNIIAKYVHTAESYPASLFSVYHCVDEVVNFGYTFVDWSRPGGGGAHPYTFIVPNDYDTDMLEQARLRGHLIARKFAPEYPSQAIKDLIHRASIR